MTWSELLEASQRFLAVKLFDLAGTPITTGTLCAMVLVALVSMILAAFFRRGSERFLKRRNVDDEGTIAITGRLVQYAVLVLGLATVLHTSGINLGALFAAGAVFAVAIGFAMQNIVQNFVSGIILLAERSIKPGDVIEVVGEFVRVKDMGIRVTVARTLDDEDLIIPNSLIAGAIVKNYTLKDRTFRVRAQVGVEYSSDLRQVREVLETTVRDLEWRLQSRNPVVQLALFGNSSVDYEVSVWIEDPWGRAQRSSDLREAIWWAFKEKNIVIAFPQLDLHADAPLLDALGKSVSEAV